MARILFVMNIFPGLGGVETVTKNLIKSLGRDQQIYVLAFSSIDGYDLPEQVREAFYFEGRDIDKNADYYNEIIRKYRITHVINQGIYYFMSPIIFNDKRDRTVKIISVLHGMPGYEKDGYWDQDHIRNASRLRNAKRRLLYYLGLNRGYNRYLKRYSQAYELAVEKSYKVVLLCDRYIQEFCKFYKIENKDGKIISILNPVSEAYSQMPEPDFSIKENMVIYAGRLSPEKNIPMILQAWQCIHVKLPDWKLVIIGDGPMRKELEMQASEIENVEFTGGVADPFPYYKKAKMVLLMTTMEGYGMVLVEGQRTGAVPVAYPSSSGVLSIIENGGGVAVPEMSAKSLAKTVYALAKDENRMRALVRSSYKKSEQNLISNIDSKWRQLLK